MSFLQKTVIFSRLRQWAEAQADLKSHVFIQSRFRAISPRDCWGEDVVGGDVRYWPLARFIRNLFTVTVCCRGEAIIGCSPLVDTKIDGS